MPSAIDWERCRNGRYFEWTKIRVGYYVIAFFTKKAKTKKKMAITSRTFNFPPLTGTHLWVQSLLNLVVNQKYKKAIRI
jgi:hypothetical protein